MSDVPYGNLQDLYTELLERYRRAVEEKEELMVTAQRRTEAYARKEDQYRDQLTQLQTRMQKVTVGIVEEDDHMKSIRSLHNEIQEAISKVQGKTSEILMVSRPHTPQFTPKLVFPNVFQLHLVAQ